MYKKIILTVTIVICTLAIAYTAIISIETDDDTTDNTSYSQYNNTPIAQTDTNIQQYTEGTNISDIKEYRIQSADSRLNIYQIYSNGYKELIQSVEINTSVLPEEDRQQLEQGIITANYNEVCSLIEDFSS